MQPGKDLKPNSRTENDYLTIQPLRRAFNRRIGGVERCEAYTGGVWIYQQQRRDEHPAVYVAQMAENDGGR